MSRLVNVSNRVPVHGTTAPGGLAVGVLAAMQANGGLWFGWNGKIVADEASCEPELASDAGIVYATMPLPQTLHEHYYCGFANSTLWPLFHYFVTGFRYEDHEYAAYQQANALFARKLAPLLQPSDLIWVHDYQLMPLGEQLRAQGVRQRLGFFLHIPFPHFEILRSLPPFTEIVRALLAYDLIGFQTQTDRQSFIDVVGRLGGHHQVDRDGAVVVNGRKVCTGVFPIGVEVEAIGQGASRASLTAPVQRMVKGLLGRRLILGVDRLDPSKGLLERFRAYRHFLEHFPQHRGQVTYLQIAPLGRQRVPAYTQIRDALEQSSGRTNGGFADTDWTPIRYLNRNFPHATLMGFLRSAQVCLVTPLRDGMNLVAKEFVAAQDPEDPGVLILSNRTGAACELTDALLVNPYDTRGISQALQAALSMPLPERRQRHERLLAALRENDIHRWYLRFVEQLSTGSASTCTERRSRNLRAAAISS
jgi:trehalose 6-phosphate synthase